MEALAEVAAAGGFLVALTVFFVQYIDRRRRFADGVTAWINVVIYSDGTAERFEAVVGNASGAAVFDVLVLVQPLVGPADVIEHEIGTVPPGEQRTVGLDGFSGRRDEGQGERPKKQADFAVDVRFTDSAGRRWRRDALGKLHRWRPHRPHGTEAQSVVALP